eukprot:TRINITY_DN5667_c0_g2_i1.p2 TRINITY_DN5667_c0_g2~~TRINITY_DN5667_c0_g2_i1.p2  ORF type:complete len:242 (+),score=38.16 TRINITY_DN5667_c0_g2_i1:1379-2104(+)
MFYQVLMEVMAMTVNDKTTAVSLQAITVNEIFVTKYADRSINKSPDFNNQVDILLEVLLEKLGDNNLRVKSEAEKTILAMAKNKNFETPQIVSHISRKYQLNKFNNSFKHTQSKLEILQKIIAQYKIKNDDVPFTPVMNYTIQQIDHQNREVRITSLDLFFQIYSLVGEDKITPFFDQIKQNHLEIIKFEIEALKSGGKGQTYKEPHKAQPKLPKQNKGPVDERMPQVGIKNRAKKKSNKK